MKPLRLSLRAGEKLYVNGAVLRVDQKVTIELLNDATFLMQNHVLQPQDATTPLRQLYFLVQTIFIAPEGADDARQMLVHTFPRLIASFSDPDILAGLALIEGLVAEGREFEALRRIRSLFPIERGIIEGPQAQTSHAA
jgi:flagellar biosynthesis repressor protein FlbT